MTSKPELTDEQVVTLQLRIMSARSFYCQLPGIEAYEAAELLTLCGIAASELQERRKTDNAEPIYQCEFCHHDANGDLQWHWEDVNKDFYDQYDSERRGQRRMIYATPQPLNDAERAELQERRKADSAEPVSFDELNAAVAEVTGGNQHAWDANIYKGHQAVPFMNYNSLARIVDKYRTPPAPVVPEALLSAMEEVLRISDREHEAWNKVKIGIASYRAAMLQAGNSPVSQDGWMLVPKEPTMAMLDEFDSIIDHGAEDSKDAWSRLISAAPQQEVNRG